MHLMCWAWGVFDSWEEEAIGGVDTDTVAWVPCADQRWVGAGIDQAAMSCLWGETNETKFENFSSPSLPRSRSGGKSTHFQTTLTRIRRYLTSRRAHICQS